TMKTLGGKHKGQAFTSKTNGEYICAMTNFANWLFKTKHSTSNPLAGLRAPQGYNEDPTLNRRPLIVSDFNKLMRFLKTAGRYRHQMVPWTAHDRAMLYWTAVMTGLRVSELRSLTRGHFDFTGSVATITVKVYDAKGSRL